MSYCLIRGKRPRKTDQETGARKQPGCVFIEFEPHPDGLVQIMLKIAASHCEGCARRDKVPAEIHLAEPAHISGECAVSIDGLQIEGAQA